MRFIQKNPKSDLRKYYYVILELSLIAALLISIVAMRVDFGSAEKEEVKTFTEQENVKLEEVVKTKQNETPPPPPQPKVPIEVPNDQIVPDQDINIDADLSLDEPLEMPDEPEKASGIVEEEEEENFFIAVEQMPELKGGLKKLQQSLNYPKKAAQAGIEGRVIIQFIVSTKGKVRDAKVIRGIGGGCDEEALRVVKQASFKPGRQRGSLVPVQSSLPITFKLKNR